MTELHQGLSPALETYLKLQEKLSAVRVKHDGAESQEEDELLDQMDVAWSAMSTEDIQKSEQALARRQAGGT